MPVQNYFKEGDTAYHIAEFYLPDTKVVECKILEIWEEKDGYPDGFSTQIMSKIEYLSPRTRALKQRNIPIDVLKKSPNEFLNKVN